MFILSSRPAALRQATATGSAEFCAGTLAQCVDKMVRFTGTVTDFEWQRVPTPAPDYPAETLLDTENYGYLAIYSKEPISAPVGRNIIITGQASAVTIPGTPGAKIEEPFTYYRVLVSEWREVK